MSLASASCKLSYRALLGIDTQPEFMSKKQIIRKAKRYGVPEGKVLVLEIDAYADTIAAIRKHQLEELGSADSILQVNIHKQAKNDAQPVQVRYFDKDMAPIFKLVNCYVDPPIPMQWNVDGALDEFPPKPIKELEGEKDHDLSFFLPLVRDIGGGQVTIDDLPEADYYALVMWNSFFIRPSKRLIRQIQRYDRKKGQGKTHFLFVNNHNAHLFNYVPDEQKEEALEELKKGMAAENE